MKFHSRLLFVFALVLSLFATASDSLPQGVSVHVLDNGLEVLAIEKPSLPMVGVNVVVKVGSAYESFSTSGMSHMLEHLLFNGTETMTQKELYDAVDMIGGYNNANTGEYYTNFMMVTPDEQIEEGMKIQADMLFRSVIPEDKFEKEKGIVLEEIAKTLSRPEAQLERQVQAILFQGHSLSLPTLGTYETIRHMKRDDVASFYKNYYVPNNMLLSIIGNFKTDDMLKKINQIYGQVAPGEVAYPQVSNWRSGFQALKGSKHSPSSLVHRFYSGKEGKLSLFFDLPKGLTEEGMELLGVFFDKEKPTLEKTLKDQFPGQVTQLDFILIDKPVDTLLQVQVTLAKESHEAEIIQSLKREMAALTWTLSPQTIQAEAVKAQASFFRNTEKPHMFGIYNASTLATSGVEAVFQAYAGSGYQKAAEVLKDLSIDHLRFSLLQHPQLDQEVKDQNGSGPSVVLLPSFEGGASIIVKQIPGSELIALHYLIKHKAFFEKKYGADSAAIWHDCFEQRMKTDAVQEEIKLFGLTFTFNDNPWIPMDNIYLDPDFGYLRVEGLAAYSSEIIQFMSHQIFDFQPTTEEFEQALVKYQRLDQMKDSSPDREVFKQSYEELIYEPNPYSIEARPGFEELLAFGKDYFQPENMIISVVSNKAVGEISSEFGSFVTSNVQEKNLPAPWRQAYKLPGPTDPVTKTMNGKQSHVFYGYLVPVESQDVPALRALGLILREKIVFNIREERGMAYRMDAGVKVIDDKALFYINMATRSENLDTLVPLLPSYFSPDFLGEIEQQDLQKRINMFLGRMMFRRLSSINQGFYLGTSLYFYGDVYKDERDLKAIKQVTLDQVQAAAGRYLKVTDPVQVIVK